MLSFVFRSAGDNPYPQPVGPDFSIESLTVSVEIKASECWPVSFHAKVQRNRDFGLR